MLMLSVSAWYDQVDRGSSHHEISLSEQLDRAIDAFLALQASSLGHVHG